MRFALRRAAVVQGGGAGPAAWLGRVEHVAVVGQGVRAAHRRLPDAQQVLAGGWRQRSVPAAQLGLRERGSEGAARPCRQSSAQRRERQPLQPCGTMGMHMAGMHGWHKWSYWEAKPLLRTVGKLPHGMDHRNRGSDTAGVNHDYFGGVKKASCLKAGSSHMLCMTFIFCNNHKAASPLCALISKPGFYKGEQLPLLAKKKNQQGKTSPEAVCRERPLFWLPAPSHRLSSYTLDN